MLINFDLVIFNKLIYLFNIMLIGIGTPAARESDGIYPVRTDLCRTCPLKNNVWITVNADFCYEWGDSAMIWKSLPIRLTSDKNRYSW